ncbi:MAG: 2-oxo acid dehydrogenase subunit E2 [Lentimicrobiaceae bacterium]|jgi:2-oxoglutarate dehydrogenase E2 component (dihydrolipoamide succinyltransferase)|nr:2-oxo acid dehydrogenase subunit E2 [Lentimicrobiaceae bacterium]MBT3454604.1 2-oxo acid dehydrogenase subunit E2 [Lentimicrobiaceae bacterium]MBT3818302.1 2-oxo acid dehydrogenase subunit E2 [Lentimicrobiaceae bacterium]MBT4062217.1 2-oxo acid dehydrogenase subunit E2 [Lentimicrobiaceae bacterium]MBT4190044.1 2-oxo acid dehydrogenase subunit E2 [Lentimicrobiaceae bacterium]
MAKFEIIMPKLGESIIEATITRWVKNVGDQLEEDDSIVEIATDKVDSEIPSPIEGKLVEVLFEEGDIVAVGTVIAVVDMDGEDSEDTTKSDEPVKEAENNPEIVEETAPKTTKVEASVPSETKVPDFSGSDRFYSPLVKSIAKQEHISIQELDGIKGSGKNGRVTKNDVQNFLANRGASKSSATPAKAPTTISAPPVQSMASDRVEEMDRMRRIISDHMVMSKQVSPHVTSFIDVDVTNIVNWRNGIKDKFLAREGEKVTFTPIFIQAAAQALKDYPQINVSLDGYKIIYRKNINIGMATALPNGNLIVPVIKNADEKSLLGVVKSVNDLANRAKSNKLQPDEIQDGTFTMTNFGSFDSLTGTPIINQPQVAILGVGAIRKKPAVIETPQGDFIGIRHIMILSLAYDHRIVDGALGGMYLKRMKELLENFNHDTSI